MQADEKLLGKCGFYCGACPTYIRSCIMGLEQGYRVWPDEWLTKEELITPDAQPENFCSYKIVDIIDYPNGRSMAIYEIEVSPRTQ